LTPTNDSDDHIEERPSGENTGYTHFWNTYSWPKFRTFVDPLVDDMQVQQAHTAGAAHIDTIVRLIK
jgi:hypothetical protein